MRTILNRAVTVLPGAAFIAVAAVVVWLQLGITAHQQQQDQSQAFMHRQVNALAKALTTQRVEASKTGAQLVPTAAQIAHDPSIVGKAGPPGSTGPAGPAGPAPSPQQVSYAVAAYCAGHGACQGPKGDPGASVTPAQVAAAVTDYCGANGKCQGPAGTAGQPGVTGPQGAQGVQGVQGPGPTGDQVASAVASYCAANNGCTGPAGPKGGKGDTGPAPSQWTFTWTDQLGTTYTRTCTPDTSAGAPANSYTCS